MYKRLSNNTIILVIVAALFLVAVGTKWWAFSALTIQAALSQIGVVLPFLFGSTAVMERHWWRRLVFPVAWVVAVALAVVYVKTSLDLKSPHLSTDFYIVLSYLAFVTACMFLSGVAVRLGLERRGRWIAVGAVVGLALLLVPALTSPLVDRHFADRAKLTVAAYEEFNAKVTTIRERQKIDPSYDRDGEEMMRAFTALRQTLGFPVVGMAGPQ